MDNLLIFSILYLESWTLGKSILLISSWKKKKKEKNFDQKT